MASRVNVRFVVILAVTVGIVFLMSAGVFWYVKARSGERYVRLGDQKMAEGEIKAADEFYARAVGKERTNVVFLKKWLAARVRKVPETETEYSNDYLMYTRGILNSLAKAQRSDVAAQQEYLEAIFQERRFGIGTSQQGWNDFIREVEESLAFFDAKAQPPALRRYRGMAVSGLLQVPGAEVSKQLLETGRDDLDAALKADPGDVQAATDLMYLHRILARRADAARDPAASAAEADLARKVFTDISATKPNDPQVLMMGLTLEAAPLEGKGDDSKTVVEANKARVQVVESMRPHIEQVGAKLKEADPKTLSLSSVQFYAQIASQLDPKEGIPLSRAAVDRAIVGAPDDPDLLMLRGRLAWMKPDLEESIACYQEVLNLPRRPVSLTGLRLADRKRQAQFEQVNMAIALTATGTAEQRPAALERAKKFRAQLAQMVADQAPDLLFIDGKLMYVQSDYRGAQDKLTQFVRAPGDIAGEVPDAMLLLADIAMHMEPAQLGLAKEYLRKVLPSRPTVEVRQQLAMVEVMLENRGAAVELYHQILDMEPENKIAIQQLKVLEGKSDDPVIKALLDADKAQRGAGGALGDDRIAAGLIDKALEPNNYDPRLVAGSVALHIGLNERDIALQTLTVGLQKHPDDQYMKSTLKRVQAAESIEATMALVDESDRPALDKLLTKLRIYEMYGKQPEAEAALAQAASLAPDDNRVIESQFVRVLLKNDLTEAGRLADRAIKLNADRADGDTYRARLQFAQGNFREAAVLLDKAAHRGNVNPAIYRLLGATLIQLGRTTDAVGAFQHAVELTPSDLEANKQYIKVLLSAGQKKEALSAARVAEQFGRRDAEFVNLWLNLEADAGNRQFARSRREEMLARSPDDIENLSALADLYINDRAWAKARDAIDKVRAKKDSVGAAVLDARWHGDQREPEAARQVFLSYIEKAKPEEKGAAYLAFSRFMIQAGQVDVGLSAMQKATELEDPKTMPITIAMGQSQVSYGRFSDAEVTFRKVIDAKVEDPQLVIHKWLIESLIQQRKLEEAEREFGLLGGAAEQDVELISQHAQTLLQLGHAHEARALLDRAVGKFPEDPLPYFRRARLELGDPNYLNDAMADLGTAIKLRPSYWQALRTRAQAYISQKKPAEAIKDMQAAVDGSPQMDDLRWELVDLLLGQDRESDATAVADAGAKLHPNDLRYLTSAGDRFARAGHWTRAAGYYKQMLAQTPDEAIAAACIAALLNATPPATAEAEAVLATPGLNVAKSMRLLLARAQIHAKQGKDSQVRSDCLEAFDQVNSPTTFLSWYEGMRRFMTAPSGVVAILNAAHCPPQLIDWMEMAKNNTLLDDDAATRAQAITKLRDIAVSGKDPAVRVSASKAAATALAHEHRWEDALGATMEGLAVAPEDVMLINNYAAILSENMHKPAEALPFAEKVYAKAPNSPDVIDTLARVYWEMGDRAKAVQTMNKVFTVPGSDADKASFVITLAGWKLQSGDKSGARGLADYLTEAAADSTSFNDQLRKDIQNLHAKIDAAP